MRQRNECADAEGSRGDDTNVHHSCDVFLRRLVLSKWFSVGIGKRRVWNIDSWCVCVCVCVCVCLFVMRRYCKPRALHWSRGYATDLSVHYFMYISLHLGAEHRTKTSHILTDIEEAVVSRIYGEVRSTLWLLLDQC
jgi:hypothetical protein